MYYEKTIQFLCSIQDIYRVRIVASENFAQEGEESVNGICLIAIPQHSELGPDDWEHQTQPTGDPIDWDHIQDSHDTPLNGRAPHVPDMLRDVPHCDQNTQKSEGSRQLVLEEIVFGLKLTVGDLNILVHRRSDRLDLRGQCMKQTSKQACKCQE